MAEAKDPRKQGRQAGGTEAEERQRQDAPGLGRRKCESQIQPAAAHRYREQVCPGDDEGIQLQKHHAGPKLERIVLNVGMSEATQNVKLWKAPRGNWGPLPGRSRHYQGEKAIADSAAGRDADRHQSHAAQPTQYEFFDRIVTWPCPGSVTSAGISEGLRGGAITRWA